MSARRMRIGQLLALLVAATTAISAADTPLVDAARAQNGTRLRALVSQGADVSARDAEGSTALHWAAHWNDLRSVDALLRAGASVDARNRYGVTALSEASVIGETAMIRRLLDAGADPNLAVAEGETPLMRVARTGNVESVQLLIDKGASVNAREHFRGATPLLFAVAENHAAVARLLIARGADVNVRTLAFDNKHQPVRGGSIAYYYINGGLTALLLAAREGAVETGQALIEAGAETRLVDPDSELTPLLLSIFNGHYDFAAMLVGRGADVNDGSLYLTADMRNLTRGSKRGLPGTAGSLELMKLLLARGANPNADLKKRLPPRENGNPAAPPSQSPLFRAARTPDLDAMRVLLEGGADPNAGANTDQSTPLMAVLGVGAGGRGGGGGNAVAGAVPANEPEQIAAMKLLLERGANINAVNAAGDTVLHAAAQRGRETIVQLLADNGATLDIRNAQGLTPLDLASGVTPAAAGRAAGAAGPAPAAPAPPQFPATAALLQKLLAAPPSR